MKTLNRFEQGFRKYGYAAKYGCAIALSLVLASCVRDHSLGAAPGHDAGNDVQAAVDAQPAIDAQPAPDVQPAVDAQPAPDVQDSSPDLGTPTDGDGSDVPVMCIDKGIPYQVGDVIPRGTTACPGSCMCLSGGVIGHCTGACPEDASTIDGGGLQHLCVSTGGQISSGLCCASSADFPDSCAVGACSCAPASSHTVNTCVCPNNSCFSPTVGCVGPSGVCTVGNDLSCNDSLAVNGTHGHCVTDGRCTCAIGFTLIAASGRCS